MNLNITDVPESVIASYQAIAHARGITLDDLLKEYLVTHAPVTPAAAMSPEEWERALDECFDRFSATGPLPDSAFDREHIYGREDSW